MSYIENSPDMNLSAEEASLLEELNLKKVLILTNDGGHEIWEPKSIADVIYYLEREIAEIENLLKTAFDQKRQTIAKQTNSDIEKVTFLDVAREFRMVPAGGPSDADLRRKQTELDGKLGRLKNQLEKKAA